MLIIAAKGKCLTIPIADIEPELIRPEVVQSVKRHWKTAAVVTEAMTPTRLRCR